MSAVEGGLMSVVGTGQMSAAETGQMSAAEARQMLKSQIRPLGPEWSPGAENPSKSLPWLFPSLWDKSRSPKSHQTRQVRGFFLF